MNRPAILMHERLTPSVKVRSPCEREIYCNSCAIVGVYADRLSTNGSGGAVRQRWAEV